MARTPYLLTFIFLLILSLPGTAQTPEKWTSSEIYEGVKKLNFLGSALYVAAHPDDEKYTLDRLVS
jgi:hypothetical protein